MATQAQINAFVSEYSSYAQYAAAATGLNPQLILAQWGNETAYGTDFAEKNNIGNVGVYGGGPNPSYANIGDGIQAYINEMKSPAMASVLATAGQSIQAQAAALGASDYAGGKYLATGSNQPGSALLADVNVIASGGYGTAVSGVPTPSGAGGGATGASGNPPTASNSTLADNSTTQFNIPGYGKVQATGQQATALDTITATLTAYGFTTAQASQLTGWAWGEISNNVDPTQIAIDLQTPGTTGYQVFEQQFPGFVAANAELNSKGLPSVSVQSYSGYQTYAMAAAQAAGLPPGMITPQNIGTLVGGNVSQNELNSRINNALVLAYQSTPEQQTQFNQYFGNQYGDSGQGGLTVGQIAALALDPSVAEPLIAQQITTAQIGGAAVTSGVGAIDKATAQQLAQAGITPSQATSAFQNLAPYSALETARPGMGGEAAQGTVSADQLATGQLLGDPGAQRKLQTAVEVAKAPFAGGGGFVQDSKGAVGTGSASSSGAGNG